MDGPDEGVLDVDLLADDGSDDESEVPPSSDFYPGPASTPTSCASSPRGEEPASPLAVVSQPAFFHHQAYTRPFFTSGRRGPGRPRKEGPKLAREGKIVRRYRGNLAGSVRGAKRHRTSRDEAPDDIVDEDDFTMPAPEEPPYMPEKWPGKVCALCNLSERSQLGQGEMRQFACPVDTDGSTTPVVSNSGGATPTSTPSTPVQTLPAGLASPPPELMDGSQQQQAMPLSRRQKAFNKCKTPLYNMEHTDELSIIGFLDCLELPAVVSSGMLYVHRCCLEFSPPFHDQVAAACNSEEDKEQLEEARVRGIVTAALNRKCAFCLRHGASIPCKFSCSKYFHLPCVLASGGFMDFQSRSSFCKDHLYQVPVDCSADIDCRTCRTIGDITNLMTCVACGGHYHGTCVGLAQLPGVRAGWSCRACRVCQVCRGEAGAGAGEARAVACEHCDKLYHATCLRPVMATVPKYGWKCKCCRVCSDCGARSPGAGPSSRWHAHYTVCDSCYQQRNKGSCCPLCRRAYRAAAYRDMIRCSTCRRYVHGLCDPDADPQQYRHKKEQNPTYEYSCPICKANQQLTGSKPGSFEDDNMASTSQDSSFGDDTPQDQDPLALEPKVVSQIDVGLGKGKPYTVSSKVAKKKIGGYKLKGGYPPAGKLGFQKRQRSVFDLGRKRGSKPKMRGVFGVPGLGLQRPQAPDNKTSDDDPGVENKLVLCSSKDKFVLTQDLCVMCGAIGTDSEGCLIACSQCGQTYHPYCVSIKVSQVIVSLGWRCLDCTVCEGCGSRGDEPLLVLCDDCDTAWHTYCARPTLPDVPRGAWRCPRCRRCLVCGTRDTALWCDNYTECAPCASLVMCCVCTEPYSDGELIIQCTGCSRWLHAACDSIRSEADAETCCRAGYKCLLCRGRDVPPPHLARAIEAARPPTPPAARPRLTALALGLAGEYYVDDVCLSQRGAHHMKQLEAEMGITHTRRKRRFKNENNEKDAEIMASIETVVQNAEGELGDDSKPDSTAEVKEEPGLTPTSNLKEGILWNIANDGPVPEGFTIYTTDSGLTVLRRKRQRNLNKLGIGGFVVRQRQNTKAQADDEKEGDGTQGSSDSPSNKRKPRRKPRSKLMEQFPSYMQEAFFGKELLEPSKPAVTSTGAGGMLEGEVARGATPEGYRELRDFDNSDSDGEDVLSALYSVNDHDNSVFITLNTEESDILQSLRPKEEKDDGNSLLDATKIKTEASEECQLRHTEDSTALKNALLGPPPADGDAAPVDAPLHTPKQENISAETSVGSQSSRISPKDELSLLGVSLDAMVRDSLPDMDSNDVDEIFKGVLTDDSQESQESTVSYVNSMTGTPYSQRQQLQSPMEYASPYHSEFGSGSALSPLYGECSGGSGASAGAGAWSDQPAPPPSYNQRSADKMRADESLGSAATISAVLYANTNHPEWKTEFPNWVDRCKQILKKWRALPSEQKAPYLQRARDNRSAIRMKKAQQSTSGPASAGAGGAEDGARSPATPTPTASAPTTPSPLAAPPAPPTPTLPAPAASAPTVGPGGTEQERACSQQRTAREAEQERQWKQLQQMRQQQTQQQQQIIHDQRIQAAMQRIRGPDGSSPPGAGSAPSPAPADAPRAPFPAQRFPLYATNEDINRQLRDLLQRHPHPDKLWPPQRDTEPGGDDSVSASAGAEGGSFRAPPPVALRARAPLPHQMPMQHRPDHMIIQHRLIGGDNSQIQQNIANAAAQQMAEQKQIAASQGNATTDKQDSGHDQGTDEMDIGDMDKLEQDTGNIGEVDILTGLSGEDDEKLLESLTSEIGEQFNILEYADPELAALGDEHLLDGLDLPDDVADRDHPHQKRIPEDDSEQKGDNKMDSELQKAVKNIEYAKMTVKSELGEVKSEILEAKTEVPVSSSMGQMFQDNVQRVISQNHQIALHQSMQTVKGEVKAECEDSKESEWPRPVFSHMFGLQIPTQQSQQIRAGPQGVAQQVSARPQGQIINQHVQFTQNPSAAVSALSASTQSIVNAMTAQVQAALAAGRSIAPGTRLLGADGAVGVVRQDRSVALAALPHSARGMVAAARQLAPTSLRQDAPLAVSALTANPGAPGVRSAPPPPYPGLRAPPPPPYPQLQAPFDADWGDWLHRRPLLLQNVNQEQPLLLEELLEQEKREQEREGGEWSAGPPPAVAPAPPPPAVPLFAAAAPPQPPPPPERAASEADQHARLAYEQWLAAYNTFASDQLRYYEQEVQKLRKIRKSLNSKQRQLRKSGNELMPNDAAELQRVSTEQQALQKHLEAARKQARQHSMLIQEYETKQRQLNPQMAQQTIINQQQISNQTVFAQQNQNINQGQQMQQQTTLNRPMQIGLQGTTIQQQTLIRTQQTVLGSDGQPLPQQRIGLVTSPLNSQGRILQGARTLVIEQTGSPQQQLVRQLSGVQERPQSVSGIVQFNQQQMANVRNSMPVGNQTPRPSNQRPVMSPLHVQSPHSQSPLHSLAPQSPLHPMASPMQSPLHSQQSPLHHTSQSPLHSSTQSPHHTQQSPMHSQQSPMHVQQTSSLPQQSPMHPQQSPMHPQQSPIHQQSPMHSQNQMTTQHSPMHPQQSPMHPQQSPMHPQQSPMHPQQSPIHPQQSPMHPQQSPMHPQQSPMHHQQSPMHSQQSPMHLQQSPMHTQQSPIQSSMSPQHFIHQFQAQRTSPQLPTPSRSPQIYQQSQIQSPVASHSPQLQNNDYTTGRFSRPTPGCSPLPTRFARPPHHQQGMRVGVPFVGRQQTSPLGSPQPLPSPGNSANEMTRQQILQRQQYSPMGGAPASPSLSRSPHVARTPTPSASPAASPAPHHEHGGGNHHHHHMAPFPPGYRYFKPGLFGGAPVWPTKEDDRRRTTHINKVSILKRRTPPRPRFAGKTGAPGSETRSDDIGETSDARKYVLYSSGSVEYSSASDDSARMSFSKDDDDEDMQDFVDQLDDDDIVVVEPGAISPEERIATEEDFEELIDSGKPEDEVEEETFQDKPPTRTETTTKTVAVISLAPAKQPSSNMQQYKIATQGSALSRLPVLSATVLSPHTNTKILNEVSQATVASVSIANQTISVPVLKNLSVPIANVTGHASGIPKPQMKKVPLNITNPPLTVNMSSQSMPKPMNSVISVISSNVAKNVNMNPVITLATSNTIAGTSRVPVSILTQPQVKQKIVKTIEKPMALSLSNTKLSSLSVTHDATLPAKIFQDDAASPDSTVTSEHNTDIQNPSVSQHLLSISSQEMKLKDQQSSIQPNKDIDIESEISKQTELPHTLCMSDRTPLLLGKADIKSPDPIPEKIPDNIMEGDDEDKPEDSLQNQLLLSYNKTLQEQQIPNTVSTGKNSEENVVKTIKAIANQTKEMVIDSNMQITSDITQDSVQISIPSPTPSQERYLNDITMREHSETVEGAPKHVESFEHMLSFLENITDDSKRLGMKQASIKKPTPQLAQNPNLNPNLASKQQESRESQEPIPNHSNQPFSTREVERLAMQSATIPQLSPLSQPAELTSNMANVSQQLRSIMSSLNTNTPKTETQTVMRKNSDATAPTQVNFETLLPSSKVEISTSRPSPIQRIEKPQTSNSSSEIPMSAAQLIGSRLNTLSTMGQIRKSPTVSPINSPVGIQNPMMKSPAQSPLINNQTFNINDESHNTTITSQMMQMPALSKIHNNPSTSSLMHSSNITTTSVSNYPKPQSLPTSILGHTLLQPTRQISTSNLQFNPQNISSSQPPALVMTSRAIIGNKEPAPNVTVRTHSIVSTGMGQIQQKPAQGPISFVTSSKLLHTQLTSPLKRSKSTDEPKSDVIVGHIQPTKRHSVESVIVKSEPMETDESNNMSANATDNLGNKIIQQNSANQRNDESQNVLLKQLLQTTTTTSTVVPQRTVTIQRSAPALGTIPSLEAQLARPAIPPPTLALTQEVEIPKSSPRHIITTVSSPYSNRPIQTSIPTSAMSPLILTQSLMDVRKTPMKFINKEETTPLPECSPTIKTIPVYPTSIENQQLQQTIKKEVAPPQQSPIHRPFTPLDVKKELLDESSQQSATSGVSTASDQGKLDQPMKEEFPESVTMESSSDINPSETPSEAKRRKRREYQQKKRKQMQLNMKAAAENNMNAVNAKKRPRKGSRYEEDYDTFIDNLMAQLRLLPAMQIQEPALTTNFAVCPLFGSGDLTKLKNKDYDILKGDLLGDFGNAKIPSVADYYNTKPFGDEEPLPEKPASSTQRGFYDQEFQPIVFDEDPEDKKLDFICKERDTDTPDTIVSCSSPEGYDIDHDDRFPYLKPIDNEDDEEDEESSLSGRVSPDLPLVAPIPIRVKPLSLYQLKDEEDNQKSLKTLDTEAPLKTKLEDSPSSTESNENVTVTLTLTSGAAEDILGVLKELAGILHIPPPTSYQIIERTATPPSHKLGLYRSKGKDGKEGTPIDIQSILNGAAKFCRHCDVVILDSVVRAKASEFPLLSANKGNAEEILCDSDSELYFCSTQCYERFAWRPTNIILDGKSKTSMREDSKSDIETNLSKDRDDFDTASTESMETDELDIKPDIKDEKMDFSFIDSLDNDELMKEVGDDVSALDDDLKSIETDEKSNQSVEKEKFRGTRYKTWSPGCIGPPIKYKRPTDRELTELVFRTGVAIMPVTNEDSRKCELCGIQGDGVADGVSRLLNCDVDRWVHLNCALWSEGVYETVSGALMNVDSALANGSNATCAVCRRLGATVRCFKVRCGSVYHVGCAVKENCVFYKNKTAFCASHAPKNEKDNELTTLSVGRRVFVCRDEQRQVASVMLHSDTNHLIRVGGLIFLSPGHLLPHQLAAFHTPDYIYPIGYKIVRFYWSMRRANSRCRYVCWISEEEGRPRFHVRAQDEAQQELSAPTPRAAWAHVLDAIAVLREGRGEEGVLKLWPNYVTGEDLFGLTEPAVVRVLESLPGIETLTDYRFKFGRSALLEGGLAVNPSGCARSEARCARVWRRPAARSLQPAPPPPLDALSAHPACPYSKQFVHTKSSQYKKMKLEWRNNVYLARSKIQGLGLYAARDLEKHTMVIEYIGEIIRSELSEIREKQYEAKNRGIYMFRLDERRVIDATLSGGLARYINHSCQPNCVTEKVEVDRHLRIIIFAKRRIARGEEVIIINIIDIIDATLSGGLARYINHSCQPNCVTEKVEVDRHLRIIIFAKRRIARGEELAYDYKFDIEDDAHKIMCMCGAPNCRKWMN
ncbi:histone-lysine N-methyltransferase 2C isoform X2 [Bicyclus anynana]|uniref:Histone-lysine N-methyltransferase 2C isoform X2 n=1 Tax=Bicyclus anynana TaxID=110368 RepID=A0ABM3LNM3_BICAN|nr:histone-lysine N-methyltransferase 2C isoform X2 [Bicyclus anynana]